MSRSLFTGITGLRAHQQKLDVVANNLANTNTIGYKGQSIQFSDLIYQNLQNGTLPSENGGTNPISIGTGVQVSQISRQFGQGTLQDTGETLDFAIEGEGFFTVTGPGDENLFTRAGSFSLDSDGRLVDPSTGNLVQRLGDVGEGTDGEIQFQNPGDNSINVPLGAPVPGSLTENLEISGNLPSTARPPSTEVLLSISPFQTAAGLADSATLFNDLTINQTDYAVGDEIQINGTNPDGSPFSGSFAVETATLGDFVTELNNLLTGATASLTPDGSIAVTADAAGEGFLSLVVDDALGNVGGSSFGDNALVLETDGFDGDTQELSLEVFDVRGESHRISLDFAKTTANSWNVTASLSEDSGTLTDASVFNVTFNEDGTFAIAGEDGIGDANIEVQFNSIQNPQTINLDLSELSHLAADYSAFHTQDGFPPGNLVSVNLSQTGQLSGQASNGRTLPLAQLAVASFQNVGGLDAVGSNYFRESANSGDASLGTGLSGGRGQVLSGQLESSNVDLALEFTQLIIAQRGFSANARAITVADELLEDITNVVR